MSKSLSNKKTKKFADFVETENPQLSLFTLLEDDRDDYSHTIELYDFMPKFIFGKPVENGLRRVSKMPTGLSEILFPASAKR